MALAASAIESCRSSTRRVTNAKANATPFTASRRRTTRTPRRPSRSGSKASVAFRTRISVWSLRFSFRKVADMMIGPVRHEDPIVPAIQLNVSLRSRPMIAHGQLDEREIVLCDPFRSHAAAHMPANSFYRLNGRTTYIPGFLTTAIVATAARQKSPCPPSIRSRDSTFRSLKK